MEWLIMAVCVCATVMGQHDATTTTTTEPPLTTTTTTATDLRPLSTLAFTSTGSASTELRTTFSDTTGTKTSVLTTPDAATTSSTAKTTTSTTTTTTTTTITDSRGSSLSEQRVTAVEIAVPIMVVAFILGACIVVACIGKHCGRRRRGVDVSRYQLMPMGVVGHY